MTFDDKARITINNLIHCFGVKPQHKFNDLYSPKSLGIELEIKFKYYFPELHLKYFSSGIGYKSLNPETRDKFLSELSLVENNVLSLLNKTLDCGIPKGLDKYWEFSFMPINNIKLLIDQIDILQQVGLIPIGQHSLHITIGDQLPTQETYWWLFILELLYCSKDRIKNGFNENKYFSSTWARKGNGGIFHKKIHELIDCNDAVELRTLQFNGDINQLYRILRDLILLMNGDLNNVIDSLKIQLKDLELDNNWLSPHIKPDVWNKYVDNFDDFQIHLKNTLRNANEY